MIRSMLRKAYRIAIQRLYAGATYKLILNESLPALDERSRRLAAMSDHFAVTVRPLSITAPFGNAALVLAPHQDDETIGCGGALAMHVRQGGAAHIVLVHDGADDHADLGLSRAALRDLRNAESMRAAALVGIQPVFLDHPDLVAARETAARQLREIILAQRIDVVFTPWLLDAHMDHLHTNRILAEALADIPWKVRILCYEVWGLCLPNVVVVIDDVIELKRQMLDCFAFAKTALDYTNSTIGLNMYRTRLVSAGEARYVEAFTELPADEFIRLERRLRQTTSPAP